MDKNKLRAQIQGRVYLRAWDLCDSDTLGWLSFGTIGYWRSQRGKNGHSEIKKFEVKSKK